MQSLTYAAFATVEQLFSYKKSGFVLEEFPGYTNDQWGIKAHNRPWIEDVGKFERGQRIIEVGGAYSLLPKYLAKQYDLEAWIGDDFGMGSGEELWSRWGNPYELAAKHPEVRYIYKSFGTYSSDFPDEYFDRIFSVSTLEHITKNKRLDVFLDINRCLKKGGIQLHTIDIPVPNWKRCLVNSVLDKIGYVPMFLKEWESELKGWVEIMEQAGISIKCILPNSIELLKRSILVESPDVVYRFYKPTNDKKPYNPAASLLLIIEKY